jgi:hypothetical protein
MTAPTNAHPTSSPRIRLYIALGLIVATAIAALVSH